jgi:uncharacterized protein involved in high-affinity Fe2+ transport
MNRNTFVLTFILLLVSTAPLAAQLREHPDESLKGVKGVRVVVNYQAPVEAPDGLTRRQLQSLVDLQLRADNVGVLTADEWNRAPGKPYLNINVVGTQVGSGKASMFFFSFAADLIQEVSLSRAPMVKTDGSTWNQDYALVVPRDDLRDVTMKISAVAHDFAESIHEANEEVTARAAH